jgi:putative flippase GtrA
MKLQCTAGFVLTGLLGAAALALAFVSLFSGKKQPEEIAQVAAVRQAALIPLILRTQVANTRQSR